MGSEQRKVTIWSVLALCTLVVLGGATWFISWMMIGAFVQSGDVSLSVNPESGQAAGMIEFTPGDHYVHYQSPVALPTDYNLYVLSADAQPVMPSIVERHNLFDDRSYSNFVEENKFQRSGIHGKPVYLLRVNQAGRYRLVFNNANEDPHGDDVIVLHKNPGTLSEARRMSNVVKIAGLSITGGLFVLFYVMHGVTLNRRNRPLSGPANAPSPIIGERID